MRWEVAALASSRCSWSSIAVQHRSRLGRDGCTWFDSGLAARMVFNEQNARVARDDEATRACALASSIAIFLGDMTLAELEEVDAKVMEVRARRDAWARHVGDSKFHRVLDYANGSVITACRGRWEITDEYETEARPAVADRCGFCNGPSRAVEHGLAELAQVAPEPRPLFDGVMSDESGDR